jgi:hypothetical protein
MKRLIIWLLCLVVVVTGGVYFVSLQGKRMEEKARAQTGAKAVKPATRNVQLIPGRVIRPGSEDIKDSTPPPEPNSPPRRAEQVSLPNTNGVSSKARAKNSAGAKEQPQDPMARVALSEVGVDPFAEEYWLAAINDPTLSDHEREDLIEDLNEEGFDDPKNLTADDLPLILRRIEIIETYAPDAMDDTNAAAFLEAYKDLLNMYAKVAGL